jgi:hypothetical protein
MWTQVAQFVERRFSGNSYAAAVAVDGDYVAVGDRLNSIAYVYERNLGGANAWGEAAKFTHTPGTGFGASVTVDGKDLAISAIHEGGFNYGAVHIYARAETIAPTWQPMTTVTSNLGASNFGLYMALENGVLLAGGDWSVEDRHLPVLAFIRNHGGRNAWGLAYELPPLGLSPGPGLNEGFGRTLGLDGGTAVVSAINVPAFATYDNLQPQVQVEVLPPVQRPSQGQRFAWTIRLYNNSDDTLRDAELAADMPQVLSLAAPVTLSPPQPAAKLAQRSDDLPMLASGLVLTPGTYADVTVPISLPGDAALGVPVTTTFAFRGHNAGGLQMSNGTAVVTPRRNEAFLPMLDKAFPIYLAPGFYPVNSCDDTRLVIDGSHVGQLYECVVGVEVRANGFMQFNFAWSAHLKDWIPYVRKYGDYDNREMYLTDNAGNRYDHVDIGGAAEGGLLYDQKPIYGHFVFQPAALGAHTFVFHDDDQGLQMKNIVLKR